MSTDNTAPSSDDSEHQEVEVISSIASPVETHLANSFEQLWLATGKGTCSQGHVEDTSVHRRSVASITSAWFAMESAVNKALYFKLRYKDSPYYLPPAQRGVLDREMASGFAKSLSFEKRLAYLAETKQCCSKIADNKGKIGQFEKLRNSLVHGYVYQREALAEADPSGTTTTKGENGETLVLQIFSIEYEELQDPSGKNLKVADRYKELGLKHDETRLCSHDAAGCLFLAIEILVWLDQHYGVAVNAGWSYRGSQLAWQSRVLPSIPSSPMRLTGSNELKVAWKALDDDAKQQWRMKQTLDAKKSRGRTKKRKPRRKR